MCDKRQEIVDRNGVCVRVKLNHTEVCSVHGTQASATASFPLLSYILSRSYTVSKHFTSNIKATSTLHRETGV